MARHTVTGSCALHGGRSSRRSLGALVASRLARRRPTAPAVQSRSSPRSPSRRRKLLAAKVDRRLCASPQRRTPRTRRHRRLLQGVLLPDDDELRRRPTRRLLAENREELFRQFINVPRKSPAARKHLRRADGQGHARDRQGQLPSRGALQRGADSGAARPAAGATGAGGAPPVPLAAATGELVGAARARRGQRRAVPSSVKIARARGTGAAHAVGRRPAVRRADHRRRRSPSSPIARSRPRTSRADVYDWMRCQAARVLANQFAKGG